MRGRNERRPGSASPQRTIRDRTTGTVGGRWQAGRMALRWYSTVIDCKDVHAQADWWSATLGWRKIFEAEDEVVLIPAHATEEFVRDLPWEQVGPGLVFVPVREGKEVKNRLHIDLAPHTSDDRDALIRELERRGATRVDVGQGPEVTWTVLADPEGNEFCVLSSRDR